jgi:hypothetical protein
MTVEAPLGHLCGADDVVDGDAIDATRQEQIEGRNGERFV